jgi:6-phosphogluconolactonase
MRLTAFSLLFLFSFSATAQNYYLFIGTYTKGKSKGIYVYDFNASTGKAKQLSVAEAKNPSYLAIARGGNYVYAVNENGSDQQGDVSAFSFSKKTGQLHFINKEPTGGADPCFLAVDHSRKWAIVANYSGGSLSALPIKPDGSIDTVAELIQHTGAGVNKVRQEKAHVHSTFFTPDEHYILCADLGTDKITIYRFNANSSKPLVDKKDSVVNVLPGSGPRHLAFHPYRPFVYVIEELTGTVDVYQNNNGKLTHLQRISSVPNGFTGDAGSADIHVSTDGKFLYASNRGDANNLVIYAIDSSTGKLRLRGFQSVLGKHPRNFIIEPGGNFLLVANRDSDDVIVFKIDHRTGLLQDTGKEIQIPNPVCLKLLKR